MEQKFNELYTNIQLFIQQQAHQDISRDICFLIQHYRNPAKHSPHDTLNTNLQQQLQLGQGAFFAGLWTHHWLKLQEQYFSDQKSRCHAQRWVIKLMHKIQNIPKNMWTTRNHILHNISDSTAMKQKHDELDQLIQDIYNAKPHPRMMDHCDNLYFNKYNRTKLKNMKIQRKTNWIAGAQLILARYERSTSLQSARFASYFQWDNG